MALTTIKLRDKLYFHFHDDFVAAEHPHAPGGSSKGGQFVSKGGGGGGTTKTKRVARGNRQAGFESLERAEKSFTLPGGGKLPKHIADLKIPPAWTNVRYNPDPKGDLLVSGTDTKGRRQPLYSEKFSQAQAAKKFDRIKRLEAKLPGILDKNQKLISSKDGKTSDLASVLALVMHTGVRPGSETDTGAEKHAYGATTLEGRHVTTDEDVIRSCVLSARRAKTCQFR